MNAGGQDPARREFHRRLGLKPVTLDDDAALPALHITVLADGTPAEGAQVGVWFDTGGDEGEVKLVRVTADGEGRARLPYEPDWTPLEGLVVPHGRAWSMRVPHPRDGLSVRLPPLPKGPIGWWHAMTGHRSYDPHRGAGIRIGVVDTGAGPSPHLSHVTGLGAFLEGEFIAGEDAAHDVHSHGTAIVGLLAARPPVDSDDFCGLVPGAEIGVVRVNPKKGKARQADIATAIDLLSGEFRADLINLSLGGAASAVEHEAIIAARQRGSLCVASAGNGEGGAVTYPAAYPECVAVSALGLMGTMPAGSLAASWIPETPDRFTPSGLFVPDFISEGCQINVVAPGAALISTLPARFGQTAPYGDMSGTSLAAPLVTGTLASILSRDPFYAGLPRGAARADYARQVLHRHLVHLGMAPWHQGAGAVQATGVW